MGQFDLSLWLKDKSRKVVTRDGREVRILDYNLKGDKRICIAVDDKTQESITTVDEDGHCLRDKTGWHESNFDLFFADEKEQDEFENTMISFAHAMFDHLLDVTKEIDIKEWKDKLLDLTKKEIRKEQQEKLGTLEMPIDVTEPYYIKGKQDALKDLDSLIEDKVAEKFAELFGKLPMQPYPYQPNPNQPNPFQPISVLYGCPADFPTITYGTKTQQDND